MRRVWFKDKCMGPACFVTKKMNKKNHKQEIIKKKDTQIKGKLKKIKKLEN